MPRWWHTSPRPRSGCESALMPRIPTHQGSRTTESQHTIKRERERQFGFPLFLRAYAQSAAHHLDQDGSDLELPATLGWNDEWMAAGSGRRHVLDDRAPPSPPSSATTRSTTSPPRQCSRRTPPRAAEAPGTRPPAGCQGRSPPAGRRHPAGKRRPAGPRPTDQAVQQPWSSDGCPTSTRQRLDIYCTVTAPIVVPHPPTVALLG